MTLFLIFLFALGVFATLVGQSLIEQKGHFFIVPAILMLLPSVSVSFLVRLDTTVLIGMSQNVTLIQTLSVVMISEGILTIWLGLERIRSHYDVQSKRKHSLFFILPSSSCMAAVTAMTLAVMYRTTSINYQHIGILCGIVYAALSGVCPVIIRFMLKDWAERFEFRMMLALVQIVTAAFVPLIMNPVSFAGNAPEQSPLAIGLFTLFSGVCITGGFFFNLLLNSGRKRNGIPQ